MFENLINSAKAIFTENNIEGEIAEPKLTINPKDGTGSLECLVDGKPYSLSFSVDNEGNTEMSYQAQDDEPETAQEENEEAQNPEAETEEKPTEMVEKSADEMDKSLSDMEKPEDKKKSEMPMEEDKTKSEISTEETEKAKSEDEPKNKSDCPPTKITLQPKEKAKSYQPDLSSLYKLYFPNPIK